MKKAVLLLLSAILISVSVNAQYKINKHKYDFHTYKYQAGDKYSLSVAGVTSYFIPGLGQTISGETLRGFTFFGLFVGSIAVLFVGEGQGDKGVVLSTLGGIGCSIVPIWSVIDAVRVAKVNNLALRDKSKPLSTVQVQPSINANFYSHTSLFQPGMTFRISF
jgi:hypothetical protein